MTLSGSSCMKSLSLRLLAPLLMASRRAAEGSWWPQSVSWVNYNNSSDKKKKKSSNASNVGNAISRHLGKVNQDWLVQSQSADQGVSNKQEC